MKYEGNILIIDDGIGGSDRINNIIDFIEKDNFCIKLKSVNESHNINFDGIAFIILDWDFENNFSNGVTLGSSYIDKQHDIVLRFIKEVRATRFIPILLFTNVAAEAKERLNANKLLDDSALISITSKEEIDTKEKLDNCLDEIFKNKSVLRFYYLWEATVDKTLNTLFKDLQQYGHGWIKILYDCFVNDLGDVPNNNVIATYEVERFLSDLLRNSLESFEFDFNSVSDHPTEKEKVRRVIERTMTLCPTEKCMCGDIYKRDEKNYYINITPQCDLEREENPKFILLAGEVVDDKKIKPCLEENPIKWHKGGFIDFIHSCTLAFIDGKIIKFNLKDFEYTTEDKSEWIKNTEGKVCKLTRLLPPHITKLQKRFTQYISRESLMSLPESAVDYKNFRCKATECGGTGCVNNSNEATKNSQAN